MKQIILALTFFAVISSASAAVAGPDIKGRNAKESIKEAVVYPAFAIEQGLEGIVWLRVKVQSDGRVDVVQASSTSNDLLRYVVDKVESMVLNPEDYAASEPFNLKFDFVLL